MKRFVLMLLVTVFLPVTTANAQMAVADATVQTILAGTKLEQAVYWAQQGLDMVEQIYHMKEMIERI